MFINIEGNVVVMIRAATFAHSLRPWTDLGGQAGRLRAPGAREFCKVVNEQ